ncbi:hypothetical protein [Marinobacterium lutimaris]|uniref:hypothetical protein n=1 Tax=Marinobacterium lutimaris TaxID=568106 RepID=UPI0011AFE07E|nr:hypothetical protein [Marinobacterium lutimaris]
MTLPLTVESSGVDASRQYQIVRQLELFRIQEDPHLIYRGQEHLIVLRYLQRRVAARPIQLRNHIRRVYLAIQSREVAHLTGALVDLMLILKGKGRYLVERMLDQSRPLLKPEYHQLMKKVCDTGQTDRLRAIPVGESVLSNGGMPSVARMQ